MSIPLLPEFDADGYQVDPSTANINELVAATNTATGAAIALLPEFDSDGHQVEPSTAKLNEIITALNDGGAMIELLPTFAADGYEYLPSTAMFNGVITAVNEYEPPVTDPELVSIAVGGSYPGNVPLPPNIEAGDMLLALVLWENDPATAIDGFTLIDDAGGSFNWLVAQYRIADGNEGASITPDPSWPVRASVVARIPGVNTGGPINVAGVPEVTAGGSATSKTVELDSISPDIANAALVTLAIGETANTATGITFEGGSFALSDIQETYAGGVTLELLEADGATGTRTCVVTTSGSGSQRISAVMVALNPA